MFKNKIFYILIFILLNSCLTKSQYQCKTIEFYSDIVYADNIEIYYYFANHSFSNEFRPIISKFYIEDLNYYNLEIHNKFKIFEINNYNDLMEIKKKIYFDNILQYIEESFFENNSLGLIYVPINGLQYLKNEKLENINNKLVFSVEIWDQKSKAIPALANMVIYLVKIGK